MFKFILKRYKKETLWRELLRREGFNTVDQVEAVSIWSQVFHRNPDLRQFLNRREVSLLKAITLLEKPSDFILGQIAENRLWQRFDAPQKAAPKVEKEVEKVVDRTAFLKKWEGKKVV